MTRGKHATGPPTDKWCPSCRVRWHVHQPVEMKRPPQTVSAALYRWLENAALTFSEMCSVCSESRSAHDEADHEWVGHPVTPEDFVWWVKIDLLGRYFGEQPDMEGLAVVEHANKAGTKATRHGKPDPLPFLDRRTA